MKYFAIVFEIIQWVWEKLPKEKRIPVTVGSIVAVVMFYVLQWMVVDFPKHAKNAFDSRWHALAAPYRKDRDDQITALNFKMDTLSGNMGNVSEDTQFIKQCLITRTCGVK